LLKFTFVATSFYPKPFPHGGEHADRLHQLMELAGSAPGYGCHPTIIVDGTHGEAGEYVRGCLSKCGGAIVAREINEGTMASRKQALSLAVALHGADPKHLVCWTEEKPHLVRSSAHIASYMSAKGFAIGVVKRDPKWFKATYPASQVRSETKGNRVFAKCTGVKGLDIFSGPIVVTIETLRLLLSELDGAVLGAWGLTPFAAGYFQHWLVMLAISRGLPVGSIPVEFALSAEQCFVESTILAAQMREKRRRQFQELTAGYRSAASVLGLPNNV
jgi:hypothetical protein